MSNKSDATHASNTLPPPLKGLIHIIAKAVIADYYQELHKEERANHESSPIRPVQ